MKSDLPFWLFIAVLVTLHFVLRITLGLDQWAPDFLTVAVLLGARPLGGGAAAGLGFALGLLEDAVSVTAFGAAAAAYTVVAYLGARTRDFFIGESLFFLAGYLFLGSWLQQALYFVFATGAQRGDAVETLLVEAPLSALLAMAGGLVAVTAYRVLRR